LPHLELLDQVGSQLSHIFFDAGSKYNNDPDNEDPLVQAFENAVNPNCLDYIFSTCPSLEKLTMTDLILYTPSTVINTSITDLDIQATTILPEGWEAIKSSLPNLRNITLNSSNFLNVIVIDMPNAILNNFSHLRFGDDLKGDVYYLHIMDEIGDQ
jgi:hypothetical protein